MSEWPTPQGYAKGKASNSTPGLTPLDIRVRGLYVPPASNQLTLFAEAFPVSHTPWLADVPDQQTSGISGQSSPESFATLDPDGSWRKTCQGYSQVTLDGSLERFSETWPRAGMTRNGTAYLRQPLAPLTKGIESGSLPTPTSSNVGFNKSLGANAAIRPSLNMMARRGEWPTPTVNGNYNRAGLSPTSGDGLATAVRMWRTPQAGEENGGGQKASQRLAAGHSPYLRDQVLEWPTPTARDYRSPGTPERLTKALDESSRGQPLTEAVGGQLNPTWVEWLMGYPLGWTVCEGWATRSSRKSRSSSPVASSKRKQNAKSGIAGTQEAP